MTVLKPSNMKLQTGKKQQVPSLLHNAVAPPAVADASRKHTRVAAHISILTAGLIQTAAGLRHVHVEGAVSGGQAESS
jgi:hypothetical protein